MRIWPKKKNSANEDKRNSASSQRVYSYYTASKRQIESFEQGNQAKRNANAAKFNFGKFVYIIIGSLGLLLAVFMLGLTPSPNVRVINGPAYQSSALYQEQIADILDDNIKNYSKLTLDTAGIESQILQNFPEVEEVNIRSPIIGWNPKIELATNTPFGVLVQPDSESYIIDSSGKAVINVVNTNVDTTKLSTLKNQSGFSYNLGDQVFKPSEMESLNSLHYQLTEESNAGVIAYVMPVTPRELQVERGGYYVKFSLDSSSGADTNQQFGALVAIENSINEQRAGEPQEYIDVRLGDKVYIK